MSVDIVDNITLGEIKEKRLTWFYLKSLNVRVQFFVNSLRITDLTNAFKKGKTCPTYVIQTSKNFKRVNKIDENEHFTIIDDIAEILSSNKLEEFIQNILDGADWFYQLEISIYTNPAVRVYSPFIENEYKLPNDKNTWTMQHVKKAIMAGKIKGFYQKAFYSDDYYGDMVSDYGRRILDYHGEAEKLVESTDGWHVLEDKEEKRLTIVCHHFSYVYVYLK